MEDHWAATGHIAAHHGLMPSHIAVPLKLPASCSLTSTAGMNRPPRDQEPPLESFEARLLLNLDNREPGWSQR